MGLRRPARACIEAVATGLASTIRSGAGAARTAIGVEAEPTAGVLGSSIATATGAGELATARWSSTPANHRDRARRRHAPLAVRAFSTSLVNAGNAMIETRRDDRIAAGLVLSGLGALGMAAASAMHTRRHEELWLERAAP
jgi:hypothetical protein